MSSSRNLLKPLIFIVSVCLFWSCGPAKQRGVTELTPASYVNPFIGASTSTGKAGTYHGLGKTFPGAATPYGLVQVSPNTITGGDNGSGYSYEHKTIEGFAFTQMSGVGWNGDLGNLLVMPTTGKLHTNSGQEKKADPGYRSHYDKKEEKAVAGYYSTLLTDYNIRAEMTAAPHSGFLRFTFPKSNQSRIQIDLARRVGGTSSLQYVKVVNDHTIQGWMKCTPDGGGWGNGKGNADYTVYFFAEFSKPLKKFGVWKADIPDSWRRKFEDVVSDRYQETIAKAAVLDSTTEIEGKHLGFFAEFATNDREQIMFKSGISFVSIDGAENNLKGEIPTWSFDTIKQQAFDNWNHELKKILITGGSNEEKTVFYTALYHTMIDPREFCDVDGRFTGGDKKIHARSTYNRRTIFSGWDVFRSQFPLQTLINPTLVNDASNSLIDLARETERNYFERWELMNAYTGCMIGNPAIAVTTDAYAKGILNVDEKYLLQLAVNSSDRYGTAQSGYYPDALTLSNTLELCYTEWCTSNLASKLNQQAIAKDFFKRGQNYHNLFDDSSKWFRPKKTDGTWQPWPKKGRLTEWYGTIESNPYQQGWFVPHDIEGMIALMGGKKKVKDDLIEFFEKAPPTFLWNDYYNHANEPVHHVPFLFNYVEAPWLTQKWTRAICAGAYHNSVEGLVGNEDVGQMSAWYNLAAAGLYQVCPGKMRFDITSPVFDKIIFALDSTHYNGKTFTIVAHDNSAANVYIQRATLNGKSLNQPFIDFSDIVAGGTLEVFLGDKPNYKFGTP